MLPFRKQRSFKGSRKGSGTYVSREIKQSISSKICSQDFHLPPGDEPVTGSLVSAHQGSTDSDGGDVRRHPASCLGAAAQHGWAHGRGSRWGETTFDPGPAATHHCVWTGERCIPSTSAPRSDGQQLLELWAQSCALEGGRPDSCVHSSSHYAVCTGVRGCLRVLPSHRQWFPQNLHFHFISQKITFFFLFDFPWTTLIHFRKSYASHVLYPDYNVETDLLKFKQHAQSHIASKW